MTQQRISASGHGIGTGATRVACRWREAALAAALGAAAVIAPTVGASTAAGAIPARTSRGESMPAAASEAVRALDIAGTAWSVDPAHHTLSVVADGRVSGAQFAALREAASPYGGAVRIRRVAGTLRTSLPGGAGIYGAGYRCSLGFTVHKGGRSYFLTAGHCAQAVSTWYADARHSAAVGRTVAYTYPGRDYALVAYERPALNRPSTAGGKAVTGAADPYLGESVTRRGSTSGTRSGTVTGLDATVDYGNGDVVNGLIQTDVCSEPGDSGGALYSGATALGLTSGGDGDCTSGGTTYFQPVTAALRAYGVSIG